MLKPVVISLFALIFLLPAGASGQEREPKNAQEFAAMAEEAQRKEPMVYIVRSAKMEEWNEGKTGEKIVRSTIFASAQAAREVFCQCEFSQSEEPGPASAEAAARMRLRRGVPRPFFFSRWEGEPIGTASFERKLGMWESDPTASVCFLRGNCVITVTSGFIVSTTLEPHPVFDPRPAALALDRELRTDPLEALAPMERERLQTLEVTLSPTTMELNFPRKLPDGTEPDEIRLVVSPGGAVEPDSATVPPPLYPDPAGKFIVRFSKNDQKTVRCFHLDREGKVLAWGEAKTDDTVQKYPDIPRPNPYEGLRPKCLELSNALAKEFRPIFDGMSARGSVTNVNGETTYNIDYALWNEEFFFPLFAKARQGMIRLVGTDDCLALWEDGRAEALRRIEKSNAGSPETDFSLWLTFNRAVVYENRENFLKGTQCENHPIPGAYSGYSPDSGLLDASWEALAVFSFRNEQARRVLLNLAIQEPGRWSSDPIHHYAAYYLTLCPNAEELLPTLRALLEEEIANARQSRPETAKIILAENGTVTNPFYYPPKDPGVKINGTSFTAWHQEASRAFPRLFRLAGLIHSLEFSAKIPPEERERFDVFRREYALSWALTDKRLRPVPSAFAMPKPGDGRFLKYLEHYPPLGPVTDRFWSPGFEGMQPQSVTEVPMKFAASAQLKPREKQRPFREANERFGKMLLTENDLEGLVSLESHQSAPLVPANSVWPSIPGYWQGIKWKESAEQVKLHFMHFPDSALAREGLRVQLRAEETQVEPEVRSALGLTEKEAAFVFRKENEETFLIQSGALILQARMIQVPEPAPLLRLVLERWRACAPEEVPLPEERKTLGIYIEGKDWETDTPYPIFKNSGSDSIDVFVPSQPRRLRFELIPPDAEDLTPGSDRQRPVGGFSVESYRNPQNLRRQMVFDGSAPPFFFVRFVHPGRHVIRRTLLDLDGNILAWGETCVEVKVRERAKRPYVYTKSPSPPTTAPVSAYDNYGALFPKEGNSLSFEEIKKYAFPEETGSGKPRISEAQLAAFLHGLKLPDGMRLAYGRKIVPETGKVGFLQLFDIQNGRPVDSAKIPRYEACFHFEAGVVALQVIPCDSLREARFMMFNTVMSAPVPNRMSSMGPPLPPQLFCRENEYGDDITLASEKSVRFMRNNQVFILSFMECGWVDPDDEDAFTLRSFAEWFDGQLVNLPETKPEGDFASFWKSGTGLPEDGRMFQRYLWEAERLENEFRTIQNHEYSEPLFEKSRGLVVRVTGTDDLITLWERGIPQQLRLAEKLPKEVLPRFSVWKNFVYSILLKNQSRLINGTKFASLPKLYLEFDEFSESWEVLAIFSLGTERARDCLVKLAIDVPDQPISSDLAAYLVTLSQNPESLLPRLKTTLRQEIAYLREHKTASRHFIDEHGRVINPFRWPPENPETKIGGLPYPEWLEATRPYERIFRLASLVHSLEFNTKIPSAERERFAALRRKCVMSWFYRQSDSRSARLVTVTPQPGDEHFLKYLEEYPPFGLNLKCFWKPEPEPEVAPVVPEMPNALAEFGPAEPFIPKYIREAHTIFEKIRLLESDFSSETRLTSNHAEPLLPPGVSSPRACGFRHDVFHPQNGGPTVIHLTLFPDVDSAQESLRVLMEGMGVPPVPLSEEERSAFELAREDLCFVSRLPQAEVLFFQSGRLLIRCRTPLRSPAISPLRTLLGRWRELKIGMDTGMETGMGTVVEPVMEPVVKPVMEPVVKPEPESLFEKIRLTENDLGNEYSFHSAPDTFVLPGGMKLNDIPSFQQVLTRPGDQIELKFTIFPDSDYARNALCSCIRHVPAPFEPVPPEERAALGLTENEPCLVCHWIRGMDTYWIQSGTLLISARIQPVSRPVSPLRIVLERWRACAPKEVPWPEELKTLSIHMEGEAWETEKFYPLAGVEISPGLRFQLVSPEVEDLVWSFDHSPLSEGFSYRRENRFQELGQEFSVQEPCSQELFVRFGYPGTHVIRCFRRDENGRLLAWGETEAEVRWQEFPGTAPEISPEIYPMATLTPEKRWLLGLLQLDRASRTEGTHSRPRWRLEDWKGLPQTLQCVSFEENFEGKDTLPGMSIPPGKTGRYQIGCRLSGSEDAQSKSSPTPDVLMTIFYAKSESEARKPLGNMIVYDTRLDVLGWRTYRDKYGSLGGMWFLHFGENGTLFCFTRANVAFQISVSRDAADRMNVLSLAKWLEFHYLQGCQKLIEAEKGGTLDAKPAVKSPPLMPPYFREAEVLFEKIQLKENDFEDKYCFQSGRDTPLMPARTVSPGITSFRQVLTKPQMEDRINLNFMFFPDSDCAREGLRLHLRKGTVPFEAVSPEERATLGLTENELGYVCPGPGKCVLVQSGALLINAQMSNVSRAASPVRIVLERWRACAPKEVPPPDTLKTLEIRVEGQNPEPGTAYPLFVSSNPVSAEVSTPGIPRRLRFQLVPLEPENSAVEFDPQRPAGGFSVGNPKDFQGLSPMLVSEGPCPVPFYVGFPRPGRCLIRCFQWDLNCKVLAWGETEIVVGANPEGG